MQLSEVKRTMLLNRLVTYDGMSYRLDGCTLKYDRSKADWYYLLELHDLKANSVMIVPMQHVDVQANSQNGS